MTDAANGTWHKVAELDDLPEGRVKTVTVEHESYALSHVDGSWCAVQNACPHQGGPLGEGSIEDGWLRCPWHGWDYHPCTGLPPGGFDDGLDTFPVEVREDGTFGPVAVAAGDVSVEHVVRAGGQKTSTREELWLEAGELRALALD